MSDHIEHECPECFSLLCPSTRCLKTSRVVEPDYQARAEQAKRDADAHRAAVVADSPELAQVFDLLGRARWELWRASRSPNMIEAIDEAFIAAKRDLPSPGPQEPVPPELAQARERIAALEAIVAKWDEVSEATGYSGPAEVIGVMREWVASMGRQSERIAALEAETGAAWARVGEVACQRDAALARVAALEAERDGLQRQRDVEWERAKVARARVYELEADEARIRADERECISAAIERDHQPGTYPHEMAKAIRANATPGGRSLSEGT